MLHLNSNFCSSPNQEWQCSKVVKSASISKACIRCVYIPAMNPEQHYPQPLPQILPSSPPCPGNMNTTWSPNLDGSRTREWRLYAENKNGRNGKWSKHNETALNKHEPLPLPMAYPGSNPDIKDVEEMENCNPDKMICRDVLYQWTGKCSRCQGTGEVSYYRKRGKETICKCVACMGLGYVHKMTVRKDVDVMEDLDN